MTDWLINHSDKGETLGCHSKTAKQITHVEITCPTCVLYFETLREVDDPEKQQGGW